MDAGSPAAGPHSLPVATSQRRIVPSQPTISVLPSPEKVTFDTGQALPLRRRSFLPVATSHRARVLRSALSFDSAEASVLPSGEKAALATKRVPRSSRSIRPVLTSQMERGP